MGRPSTGCEVCRRRKIKCDELRPKCTRCQISGWPCGGYPDAHGFLTIRTFRKERPKALKKKAFTSQKSPRNKATTSRAASPRAESPRVVSPKKKKKKKDQVTTIQQAANYSRVLYPAVTDQGIAFFFRNYVLERDSVHVGQGGYHEYLPALYQQDISAKQPLRVITNAVGLASLANAAKQPIVMRSAHQLYTQAVQKVREALADPEEVKSDQTLAAVMMLGIFEAITCRGRESMESLSQHIRGLALLIDMRGPKQFQSKVALRLFLQVRKFIVVTYTQLEITIPFPLEKWARWARGKQKEEELPANRFAELCEEFVNLRAELKAHPELRPFQKITRLVEVDGEFVEWPRDLPEYMRYTEVPVGTYGTRFPGGGLSWGCEHSFADLWVSSIWGSWRMGRILLHQDVISLATKDEFEDVPLRVERARKSRAILRQLALEVCQSVPFHLRMGKIIDGGDSNMPWIPGPGGYCLIWPLYIAGLLETTSRQQRLWMAEQLRTIGLQSGNNQAIALARALASAAQKDNFTDSELWSYGAKT